jgi:hypothetical protein
MKRSITVALFGALAGVSSIAASAPVTKIQAMLARPAVLCGRFEQSKQLAGLKRPVASSGRFCVVADKGVLWRTLLPFPRTMRVTRDELVQSQGDRISFRISASQEPGIRMVNNVLFSLLAGDLTPLQSMFEVDASTRANGWSATLKARDPAVAKAVGNIALEGGAYVNSIAITEAGGDKTSIRFSGFTTGAAAFDADERKAFE